MKIWGLILILTFSFLGSSLGFSKPIEVRPDLNTEFATDKDSEEIAKAAVNCHILNNIYPYSEYILKSVVPRVDTELPILLQPQSSASGQLFQVAEDIDSTDLFHVHVRIPLVLLKNPSASLNSAFLDSTQYHLQYHSFERAEFYVQKWREELKNIDDSSLQQWLAQVDEYLTYQSQNTDSFAYSGYTGYENNTPAIEQLSKDQLNVFSQAWLEYLIEKQPSFNKSINWLKNRLMSKLQIIDPKSISGYENVTAARSVVSTDTRFVAIKPLNLAGYIQPATIYFEERNLSPQIDEVISQAKAQGLKFIINEMDEKFSRNSFPADTNWELHKKLMAKLVEAIRNSSDKYHTFKYVTEDNISFQSHYIFSWSNNYLFSINFSLHCKPELAQKSQSLETNIHIKSPR